MEWGRVGTNALPRISENYYWTSWKKYTKKLQIVGQEKPSDTYCELSQAIFGRKEISPNTKI